MPGMWIVLCFAFVLGVGATLAEPALRVLGEKVCVPSPRTLLALTLIVTVTLTVSLTLTLPLKLTNPNT